MEACDGTDDGNCPGQCDSHCLCPGPSCTQDATRTIFTGPPGLGCLTFNDDEATCLSAYELDDEDTGHLAQCIYDSYTGHCDSCAADLQSRKDCTNTCNCGNGVVDAGEECDGTDAPTCPGNCLSDCRCAPPPCTYAPGRSFVGWLANADPCAPLTDQGSCEAAFFFNDSTENSTSCYWDGTDCTPCDSFNQGGGHCTNQCVCGNNVVDDAEQCDGTSNAHCAGRTCGADCRCVPPACGDNIVNQDTEECDGTADSACPGQCKSDCTCP